MGQVPSFRILLAGWFSFDDMGATAGDVLACDVVGQKLATAGIEYDIAYATSFHKGIKWQEANPDSYTHIIFVCGPFGNGWPVNEFLDHFEDVKIVGINLSMLDSLEQWNPFDLLYERDSNRRSLPDIALLSERPKVPVVGLILSHVQKEYGVRSKQETVNQIIERFIKSREIAVIKIDTNLIENQYGLRSSGEVESVIAKMDVVITTRLHGLVLALKNHVPAIAIDPIEGRAKITVQADLLGWPLLFDTESISIEKLHKALDYGMSHEARELAQMCNEKGRQILNRHYAHFIEDLEQL